MNNVLAILAIAHIILAVVNVHDLKTKSRRPNKEMWSAFICLMPFVGAFAYERTKQRHKYTRQKSHRKLILDKKTVDSSISSAA